VSFPECNTSIKKISEVAPTAFHETGSNYRTNIWPDLNNSAKKGNADNSSPNQTP